MKMEKVVTTNSTKTPSEIYHAARIIHDAEMSAAHAAFDVARDAADAKLNAVYAAACAAA